jgi:hypothetical protein
MRWLVWRPFWDEIIFGFLGLYCARGLQRKEPFAWKLGMVWGVILLTAGIALGFSELMIGKWQSICVVTGLYMLIGVVSLVSLYLSRKQFTFDQETS